MDNLYLKEMNENDLNLVKEYNKDFKKFYGKNNSFCDNYLKLINKYKCSLNEEKQMHIYPFWLILNEKIIGDSIIKTNIEFDEIYKNYGGNISYEINPIYRNKGYGTTILHLALLKCKELGLNEVMISCNDENIGSRKVIENNYGKLSDICITYGTARPTSKLLRKYIINIDESLKLYDEKAPIISPSINDICNINRTNIHDYLINAGQSLIENETNNLINSLKDFKVENPDDINNLNNKIKSEFKYINNNEFKFKRTVEEIIKSKVYYDNNEYALILSTILRTKNIPTILAYGINNKEQYTFIELYINNNWQLLDSLNNTIYSDYDYKNLITPNGYFIYRKSVNNMSFGCFCQKDNDQIVSNSIKENNLII